MALQDQEDIFKQEEERMRDCERDHLTRGETEPARRGEYSRRGLGFRVCATSTQTETAKITRAKVAVESSPPPSNNKRWDWAGF